MEPSLRNEVPPVVTGFLTYGFLVLGPFVLLFNPIHQVPALALVPASVIFALLYVRTLLNTASRKLLSHKTKGRRNFKGSIDEEQLALLHDSLRTNTDRMNQDQVRYFALSVLAPQMIRRRVTDEYTPSKRTLTKTVTIELDLDHQYVSDPPNAGGDRYIALTLPQKGALYDQLRIADASGKLLPSLSHREYRVLAARTLRTLLQAALPDGTLTEAALTAEKLALTEVIRFARVERSEDESKKDFHKRRKLQKRRRNAAFEAIKQLADEDNQYLELAVEFVAKLTYNYAIVAVVPRNGSTRSIVTYSRVIIPDLRLARLMSSEGLRDRLRTALGIRPHSLTVSARNAVSCRSYHLIVTASPDLYLGDFWTSAALHVATEPRLEPYWRVRGRRGQNYFHMYARSLGANDREPLEINVQFYEVPPGSVGRAFTAALATCLVVLLVGFLSSFASAAAVDSQVASFLLAVPGIAAAWMGFETRPDQIFEGTVVSRLSLMSTFVLSFAASVMLMLNKSELVVPTKWAILIFGRTDPWWTLLGFLATLHVLTMGSIWWLRNRVYRSVTTRPVGDSAVIA